MTEKLQRAFEAAAKLPEREQDAIAAQVLANMEAEDRWDASLEEPSEAIDAMLEQARQDFRAGRTTPLDFDRR